MLAEKPTGFPQIVDWPVPAQLPDANEMAVTRAVMSVRLLAGQIVAQHPDVTDVQAFMRAVQHWTAAQSYERAYREEAAAELQKKA